MRFILYRYGTSECMLTRGSILVFHPGECNKKISDGRWVHVACLTVQRALAATLRPVDWNWGAHPMGGSLNKRSPVKAHERWCNVDSTNNLFFLHYVSMLH